MSDLQPILDKVAKLLQLASKNTSSEEAASAAAKAQELMTIYNLDMGMIEKQQGKVDGKREDKAVKGGFYLWQRQMYRAVAELNFCMYWCQDVWVDYEKPRYSARRQGVITGAMKSQHRLVGRQVNVAMTKTMCSYLLDAVERIVRDKLRDSRGVVDQTQLLSRWANSFREGAVESIIARVQDEREKGERQRLAAAKKAARAAGPSSAARGLTVLDLAKTEEQGNYDFLYGEGAWARVMSSRAEAARERKEENERLAQMAKDNPEEFKKLEEERKKANRSRGRGRSYRERPRDYSAYNEGITEGEKISLFQQADQAKPTALLKGDKS